MIVIFNFWLHAKVHVLLMSEVVRGPGNLIEPAFLTLSDGVTAGALLRSGRDARIPFWQKKQP